MAKYNTDGFIIFLFIHSILCCVIFIFKVFNDKTFVVKCVKVNVPELNRHYEVLGTAAAFTATSTR